jgi:hypothetical protein
MFKNAQKIVQKLGIGFEESCSSYVLVEFSTTWEELKGHRGIEKS